MEHHDRGSVALAVGLSGLAGFVDGIGFLHLGGVFVSFMSGNSTRLGVGLAGAQTVPVATVGAVIGLFVAGVMLGTWVGQFAKAARRPAVLALNTGLLLAAAALHAGGLATAGVAAMVLAMGAENAVFERNGDVAIGLTYMTGALVRMSRRLALAFTGGPRLAWLPYLLLWTGLCAGAAAGATCYRGFGTRALWIAAGYAATLTVTVLGGRALGKPPAQVSLDAI